MEQLTEEDAQRGQQRTQDDNADEIVRRGGSLGL